MLLLMVAEMALKRIRDKTRLPIDLVLMDKFLKWCNMGNKGVLNEALESYYLEVSGVAWA